MNYFRNNYRGVLGIMMMALMMGAVIPGTALAQEKRLPQTSGVDDTKMGAYRALAQLAYRVIAEQIKKWHAEAI